MRLFGLRFLAVIMVLMTTGGLGLVHIADTAKGVGDVLVTINPDPGNSALHADVDPSRGGIVTFTGFINAKQPVDLDAQYAAVQLQAKVEGWDVTAIPLLTLDKMQREIPFSVSVRIPPRTPSSGLDVTKIMRIFGSWSYEPDIRSGDVNPVEVFIYINQYYQYNIRCRQSFVQTSPGGEFDVDLRITNEGNGDDRVSLGIDRREAMESRGWAFVFDQTKWDLPFEKNISIPVHISTPRRWEGWRNNIIAIKFIITSQQAIRTNAVMEQSTYSIFIRQRGVSVPGFEPFLMLAALLLASAMAFQRRRH